MAQSNIIKPLRFTLKRSSLQLLLACFMFLGLALLSTSANASTTPADQMASVIVLDSSSLLTRVERLQLNSIEAEQHGEQDCDTPCQLTRLANCKSNCSNSISTVLTVSIATDSLWRDINPTTQLWSLQLADTAPATPPPISS